MTEMKSIRKTLFVLLAAAVCLWRTETPARAEGVITRISLTVEADLKVGEIAGERNISVTTDDSGYEIRRVEVLNENERWEYYDVPQILVELEAVDGNVFLVEKSSVRLRGAEYDYGRTVDDFTRYLLVLRLPSLRDQMGNVEDVRWESATTGRWTPSYNMSSYEVRLFVDGKQTGSIYSTKESSFDFGSYMRKAGSYRFQVRAVNASDSRIKGPWEEASSDSRLDEAAAEQLRLIYPNPVPEGVTEPGQMEELKAALAYKDRYGWIQEGDRWWYRNEDGSYTAGNWQLIDDKWYYFDSDGYMVTGWIDWGEKSYYCDPESGQMLVSTLVPDGLGRRVDSTGAMIPMG